jgi:hypothetical protein
MICLTVATASNPLAIHAMTAKLRVLGDFNFDTYAPRTFHEIRKLFGISIDDFLLSLGNDKLAECENPGASGSLFFKTQNSR